MFQPLFQALLAEGVAVFAPNVRGSGGYGRSFSQADDLERRFVAITDVRAAVESLVASGLADPSRIGVVGPLLRRLPHARRAGLVPRAVPGRGRRVRHLGLRDVLRADRAVDRGRGRHQVRRPAGRRRAAARALPDPQRRPDHRAAAGGARHATTPTSRSSRRSRSSTALQERGASPGFLLFDDEGHEVHSTANRVLFVREVVRWVTGHLLDMGEQTA